MFIQIMLQGVPTTPNSNHHMITQNLREIKGINYGSVYGETHCILTYPHKNQDLRISNSVLSFSYPYHWELSGTLAFRHQLSDLQN